MDLFDHAAAQAAKRSSMKQVEENATPEWNVLMLELARLTCLEQLVFTSDDVFDRLDAYPNPPKTHDLRAFGPVMTKAAKLGYCVKENVAPVPSRRESLHSSPRSVWRSQIYQQQEERDAV